VVASAAPVVVSVATTRTVALIVAATGHLRLVAPLSPADPLAGLVPAAHGTPEPGLGLWVMHQLDVETALIHTGDGFTVRLRAGPMPD
jgi:hypothetical protein